MPMPGRNRSISPVSSPSSLRKDEHRESLRQHLADIAQGLPGAGLALRQREGVEKQRGEVVVEAVGQPGFPAVFLGKEMRA